MQMGFIKLPAGGRLIHTVFREITSLFWLPFFLCFIRINRGESLGQHVIQLMFVMALEENNQPERAINILKSIE